MKREVATPEREALSLKVRRGGAVLIGAGLFWLLALPWLLPELLVLVARYLSGDHDVTQRGARFLAVTLGTGGAMAIAIGVFARLLARGNLADNLHRTLGDAGRRTYYTLAVSWALGVLLVVGFATLGGHGEAGPLETVQLLVLLGAVCVLARTAVLAGVRTPRGALHALLAVAVLVVAGEEVSWGQTYLQWQTPDAWKAINVQSETNLHNLFNSSFVAAYSWAALAILLAMGGSALLLASGRDVGSFRWLLLRPNLSGLVAALIVSLLLALLNRWPWFELQELCAYLLLLFWASGNRSAAQPVVLRLSPFSLR